MERPEERWLACLIAEAEMEPEEPPRVHMDTLNALGMVLQNEPLRDAAMEEVKLDLERARMEREDFRQGNTVSQTSCNPNMSLKRHFEYMGEAYDGVLQCIDDVADILETKRPRRVREALARIQAELELENDSESEN